jgi:ABC-type transport system substrate-binding protein
LKVKINGRPRRGAYNEIGSAGKTSKNPQFEKNMQKRLLISLFSLTIITTLFLSSCGVQTKQLNNLSTYQTMRVSAGNCDYGGEIKSVASIDEFTVRFSLCTPDVAFPAKLTSPIFAVQDEDFLNAHQGDPAKMTNTINGTGPYRLISNSPAGLIQLHSSSSYWGVPPITQEIDFAFMSHPQSTPITNEINNSGVITSNNLTEPATAMLMRNTNLLKMSHPPLSLVYIGFNNKISPMDNQMVRRALSMVLDRSKLVKAYLSSGSEVASQIIPANITPGYSDSISWYGFDPIDAKTVLANANFDFSQVLTLAYVDGMVDYILNPVDMVKEIQAEFAAIGVNIELKPMSQSDFNTAMATGSEMMFLNSFSALYPDGTAFYEFPFIRQSSQFGGAYSDILQKLKIVQADINTNKRQIEFDQLNQTFKDQVALIPLGNTPEWSFFNKNIKNIGVYEDYEDLETLANNGDPITVLEAERPLSLWPADETNIDTFRISRLFYDTLVTYGSTNLQIRSDLADSWESNADATQWTFHLRYGVKFSNGASLDANDVVTSFAAIWDASDANHKGRTGDFTIFKELFGPLLNQ